jgi:hypothetical protein
MTTNVICIFVLYTTLVLYSILCKAPSVDCRTDPFVARVLREHDLIGGSEAECRDKIRSAYWKPFLDNLLDHPTPFFCLGEELHVTMGQMRPMMTVEDKNARLRRFGFTPCDNLFASREQCIVLEAPTSTTTS